MRGSTELTFSSSTVTKWHRNPELFAVESSMWTMAYALGLAPECAVKELNEDPFVGSVSTHRFKFVGSDGLKTLKLDQGATASKVAEKIWVMHKSGIAHRDLHIDNIVFMEDGDPLFIDWEFATKCNSSRPYDIYGPGKSGVPKPHAHKHQAGIYWTRWFARSLWMELGPYQEGMRP